MSADLVSPATRSRDVPLRCVTYVSENLIRGSEAHWASEVEDLLFRARRWHAGVGVTGVLLMTDRHFVHVIEGSSPSIVLTLDRIQNDPRHRILRIDDQPLERRRFKDWSMAYLGHRSGPVSILSPACGFAEGEAAGPVLVMMQYLLADAARR